ncbi:MAG: PD-(D/E)XK motif protein [Gemmatimonadaceae bacterium]|nr:PD-(D/E)XK motif protein [Gemmatimonadaceae bacterium]
MSATSTVYEELRSSAPLSPGIAYRAFYGPPNLGIRAFVDGETRIPGFALRTTRSCVPHGMSLPKVRGIEIAATHGSGEGMHAEVIYEIRASAKVFADVFVELAAKLLDDCIVAPTAPMALLEVSRRVAAWARFFDARGDEGLGRSGQLGLIGELLCIERLSSLAGAESALRAWTGPSGTPHDFQTDQGAVEAKLSTSSAPERFRITSERQLDESVVPWLGLFAVTAQEVRAGGEGLEAVVDRVRRLVQSEAPGSLSLLEQGLIDSGYSDSDRVRYAVRIKVRETEFLHVRDDFPRIRPSELRANVFSVSYDISWGAIVQYQTPDADVRRFLFA